MINAVAILLVLTSIATAGVWSPAPEDKPPVLKEARRIIVVEEYEQKGDPLPNQEDSIAIEEGTKLNKLPEASTKGKKPSAKELVCDALGRCKEKITGVIGMARDKASQAESAAENATENVKRATGIAKEMGEKVEAAAAKGVDVVSEKVHSGKDNLTDIMLRGRDVAADAAAYLLAARTVAPLMGVGELIGFCIAYGTCVWITFFSSHVLSGALAMEAFGLVQSRIYPVYFKVMVYSVGATLVGHFFRRGKSDALQSYNLVLSLVMVLINMLILEPQAAKVMFERMKVEKEEGGVPGTPNGSEQREMRARVKRMSEKLKRLNGYSSWLNIITLMSLSWYLVYLNLLLGVPRQ